LLEVLSQPRLEDGPLGLIPDVLSAAAERLHPLLLAYYRILIANQPLPNRLLWPLHHLASLFRAPHADPGVRWLAIRCYCLHTGTSEADRERLETEKIGSISEADCPIIYDYSPDGSQTTTDGWILPVTEVERLTAARNAIVAESPGYPYLENSSIDISQLRLASLWIIF
jgi:midasin